MGDLSSLFSPQRVAVVGATDREGSIGRAVMENLSGFAGDVVAVNPGRDQVLGTTCYPDIGAVQEHVDLAVVVVPAGAALEVVEEAGEAGVGNVVVITAGFGERGSEGAEREARLVELAERYDLNLVGPNSLGVISTPVGLNSTFAATPAPAEGPVSFMSQSGAFVTAVLDWAAAHGLGFKDVVSLGNEAILDEVDFVAEWSDDPDTDVVLGYLEDIEDGRAFIDTARAATADTPVVVVKSGRTEAGAAAAASHTGSLAGSDAAYDAAFEQAGVLRATTVQELFDVAQVLANQPLPDDDGIAVISNAGGPAVLAADAVADADLSLASFDEATVDALDERLPEAASPRNPLDIIGDATLDRFGETLDIVLADEAVEAALVISCPTSIFAFDDLADVIADTYAAHETPMVACLMGGDEAARATDRLEEHGIPNYFDPARAVRSLEALSTYREIRDRTYDAPDEFDVDRDRAREILDRAIRVGTRQLGVESMGLLEAYGIPTPAGTVVSSADDAVATAEDIGGPVVLKVVSPEISHKSDVGGIRVDVDPGDVREGYEEMLRRVQAARPAATIEGVLVQEHVETGGATETIVGMTRDPQFGPLLLFGLGGIFVEIFEDVAFRVGPVSEAEARAMTEEIDAAPVLRGARGRDPADVDAIVETIQRLSQLATDFPSIHELDVNPLIATPDGVQAVDLRLTVEPDGH